MDLKITDYCMLGMTGYELLKKILVVFFSFCKRGFMVIILAIYNHSFLSFPTIVMPDAAKQ